MSINIRKYYFKKHNPSRHSFIDLSHGISILIVNEQMKIAVVKNIKFLSILILFISLNHIDVLSQGGSNYSIGGVGEITRTNGAAYDALAGTSIAYPTESAINTVNPSMWSFATSTRLKGGYKFNQHVNYIDGANLAQNNGKVNGMMGLFSIDTSLGLSAAIGIYPYSWINSMVTQTKSVTNPDGVIEGTALNKAIGGITQAFIGASANITDKISFGAMIFSSFGITSTTIDKTFNNANVYASSDEIIDSYDGWGIRTGAFYKVSDDFLLGAFYEFSGNMTIDRQITYKSPSLTVSDSVVSCSSQFDFPDAFGIGASYKTGKFIFAADFSNQIFSNQTFADIKFINDKFNYRNSWSTSLGIARIGNTGPGTPFLDKITYKIGGGYRSNYIEVNGSGINEVFGAIGFSAPIPGTMIIDAAITFGQRGNNTNGNIKEYFGRLSVDVSIGETWFKPFRRY
ncbi:MAG: hypothetical protein HW421_2883 [Ignavibacteria bacterium]|nr:hypothetical protein [Ignavibacteria bacterium]